MRCDPGRSPCDHRNVVHVLIFADFSNDISELMNDFARIGGEADQYR
jgi:hypothetical protein